ncbi:MAG: carboxymuconolactone decarboxylase family protein [Isosphaeraceae bacterium]
MSRLEAMKEALGEESKDLRLNLGSVLQSGSLEPRQRYGIALTSAVFLRSAELAEAILEEGREHLNPETVADARAAAAIMAMNTVYYRFRHMVAKDSYQNRAANLRMTRMARPATSKLDFELFSMACAALAGCEVCIKSHEESLRHVGASEDQIHDSVRIAAVVHGFLVAWQGSPFPNEVA